MEIMGLIAILGIVGFVIVAIVAVTKNRPFRGSVKSGNMEIESSKPDADNVG